MNKYFEDNKHRINIKKNIIYKTNLSVQLKKNN